MHEKNAKYPRERYEGLKEVGLTKSYSSEGKLMQSL